MRRRQNYHDQEGLNPEAERFLVDHNPNTASLIPENGKRDW